MQREMEGGKNASKHVQSISVVIFPDPLCPSWIRGLLFWIRGLDILAGFLSHDAQDLQRAH